MENLMSTKDVAVFLNVNEKMVYTLVAEKNLPATKITGKWLFPKHLVEQWIEANTTNFPEASQKLPPYHGLLIIAGSNDLLLDKAISLFNTINSEEIAVFGNLGSMGGLSALRKNLCHIASSHLLQENDNEYNFSFASRELNAMPAVVNFCNREQGIILQRGNPKKIKDISDLSRDDVVLINRQPGSGTRILLDFRLKALGLEPADIQGYANEEFTHMAVSAAVLSGSADVGLGISAAARALGLDFIPVVVEQYDLVIPKTEFETEKIHVLMNTITSRKFKHRVEDLGGYGTSMTGDIVYQQ